LGSAQWAQPYGIANRTGPPSPDELQKILDTATAAGIHTIDTARAYGSAEELVGRLTAGSGGWRIVTKLADDAVKSGAGDTLAAARESLEASRLALRRKRLDVVLLHRAAHRLAHGGALWRSLVEERERGTLGELGISVDSPQEAFAALEDPELDVIQVAASLLDQRLVRSGFFERARDRGVEVFARSIFLQGVAHLRPDELPPHLIELAPVVRAIRAWATDHRQPPAAPYLHFARLLAASVVIGVERNGQLEEILRTWLDPMPAADDLRALTDAVPDLDARLLTPSRWPGRTS
jgi:aryl-alcohol dehydrogenase-like predicted oxidoreductase